MVPIEIGMESMIKISKFSDFATVALAEMAREPNRPHDAASIARALGAGLPTAVKLLKILAIENLVVFHAGHGGGYMLARAAESISLAEIIDATELQPFGITDCAQPEGRCGREASCRVHANWRRVSAAVRRILEDTKLSDMLQPVPAVKTRRTPARVDSRGVRRGETTARTEPMSH